MERMSRNWFYLLLILIILFTIGCIRLYYSNGSFCAALEKAFKASGANFVSSEFYVNAEVGNEYQSFEQLSRMADDLAADMNIEKNEMYSRSLIGNDSIDKMEIIGISEGGKRINLCARSERDAGGSGKSYITVSVTVDSAKFEIEDIYEDLLKTLGKYKIHPKVNTCVTGYFEGKLDYAALNEVSKRVLKHAGARKVNGITDNNMISVSAYSPGIDNTILENGKKVNMNLAIRYNSYENRTYIWIAIPVITIEY
ncbi:MAG: YwmB family TATA-box binding protein [Clostridium sp.]|nr:YwmB family TATA-box binding protein [Clostridium sp.]